MLFDSAEKVVKTGTFLYDDTVLCDIRIVTAQYAMVQVIGRILQNWPRISMVNFSASSGEVQRREGSSTLGAVVEPVYRKPLRLLSPCQVSVRL